MSGRLERAVWLLVGATLCVLIAAGVTWAVAHQLGVDLPIQTLLVGAVALMVWSMLAAPSGPRVSKPASDVPLHTCQTMRDCMEALGAANQLRSDGAITEREWQHIKISHLGFVRTTGRTEKSARRRP